MYRNSQSQPRNNNNNNNKLDNFDRYENNYRILIVQSAWNYDSSDALAKDVYLTLKNQYHIKESNICIYQITQAIDLPYTAQHLINAAKNKGQPFDVVICIGVIVSRYEQMVNTVNQYLMKITLETGTPIINGILPGKTNGNMELFYDNGKRYDLINLGCYWAKVAMEMAGIHST
ncbi:Lumazine synthase [Neocallimastix sp. 'constans']